MGIREDLLNYQSPSLENPAVTQAIEQTQTMRQNVVRDAGQAVIDWGKGIVPGAEEVGRAAAQVGAVAPELVSEFGIGEPTNQEQRAAVDWYNKATNNFKDETVAPVATLAALTGSPYGFAAMVPFIARKVIKDSEKDGTGEALKNLALDSIPGVGTYRMTQEEGFAEYAEAHPLRVLGLVAASEAPNVFPTMVAARMARKSYLTKFKNKTPQEAEQIVTAEFDFPKATMDKKAMSDVEDAEFYNKSIQENLKGYKKAERTFKPYKTKQGEKEPAQNPKISKEIDDVLTQAVSKKQQAQKENIEFFKGAYGQEVTPLPTNYSKRVHINDIWKTANSITPIRAGRLKVRDRSVGGYFETKTEGIRTRGFQNFETIAHEIGHYIDKRLALKGADEELIRAATSKWGDAYKPAQRRAEGIAEFTAEYMVNPEVAKKNFPKYYELFSQGIQKDSKLKAKVDTLSNQIRRYSTQSAEAKVRGNITIEGDVTSEKSYITNLWRGTYNAVVDDTYKLRKILEDTVGELQRDQDPAAIAQAIKSQIPGRTALLLGDSPVDTKNAIGVLEKIYNTKLNEVTLKDVLAPLKEVSDRPEYQAYLKKTEAKDMYEAFNTYVTAKHFLEIIKEMNKRRIEAIDETLKTATDPAIIDRLTKKRTEILDGKADIKTPNTRQEYETVVKGAPAALRRSSELLRQFNENFLDLAVAGDRITAEAANYCKETYPYYVPVKRDFSIEKGALSVVGQRAADSYANIDAIYKSLSEQGSDRAVIDPILQTEKATAYLISSIESNRVAKALVELAKKEGGSELLIKVGGSGANASRNIFYVWNKGKREAWQAIPEGLYDFMANNNKASNYAVVNALSALGKLSAKTLRIGVTSSPMYALANLMKDTVFASVSSKTNLKPLFSTVEGYMARKDKELMAKFYAEGVPFSTYVGSNRDITNKLRKYSSKPTGYKGSKLWQALNKVVDEGLELSNKAESAPRLAEFKRMLERGHSLDEAGDAARDLTLNFARAGTWGREYNQVSAFFNAAIQGTDKVIRMFADDPKGATLKSIMYITVPTIILWGLNKDQEWYRDIPYSDKMKYWYLGGTDGKYIRIPKPDILGYVFGSVVEQALNMGAADDTKATDGMAQFLVANTTPGLLPTGFILPFEVAFNIDTYRGRPIVSERYQKKEAPDQYNLYTSEVSKGIGQVTGWSPMKIDHVLKGQTGTVGQQLLDIADLMLKDNEKPTASLIERSRFIYTDGKRTRTSEVFYDGLDKLEKRYNSKGDKTDRKNLRGLQSAKRKVDEYRRKIQKVLNDEKLNGDQKRTKMDEYNAKILQIQRKANQRYLNYRYINNTKGQ